MGIASLFNVGDALRCRGFVIREKRSRPRLSGAFVSEGASSYILAAKSFVGSTSSSWCLLRLCSLSSNLRLL